MNTRNTLLRSALAAAALTLSAQQASAAHQGHDNDEKCAGIVKARLNDCATSTSACHGSAATDAHPEAWIWVPKGTCEKIVGAYVTRQRTPDEG